jgi:hypothetical protein
MPPLIHDIILPAERGGVLERIKTGLGIGGVAYRMRRMGVDPRAAEFMEVQTKIDEVTGFAHGLWERDVRDDEMPPKVINVSRVNYLVGQVLNGGFIQFVHNSQWYESFIAGVRSGLAAIGASEHLAVFEGAARLVDETYKIGGGDLDIDIDIDRLDATLDQLEREHFSNSRLSRRLSLNVDDSWTWGDRWQCAQMLSARYISGWKDVRRVPPEAYPAALDKLAATVPDRAARRRMREDTRPWEKKAIDHLVAEAFYSDIWYTALGTRQHNGSTVWCWNFTVGKTPGQGHHQAIFVDGEAIMFEGQTDKIVARRPAPECAPGSGVASNAPDLEPGTEGLNISLLIANP